jgi:hypothetical protein
MTKHSTHAPAFSRRKASEPLQKSSALKSEGVGNAGCPLHPQPPVQQKSTGVEATGTPENPAFPHAMVLTVSFVLSPVIGLFCHRHQRIISANLTPASRRQDHTTSPSAISAFVKGAASVHRIPSRVRDDRETPLVGRDARILPLIWGRDQHRRLRQINTTGKSRVGAVSAASTGKFGVIGERPL